MSAIIQLKDSSDSTYEKVEKALKSVGFKIVGDSAIYLAVQMIKQDVFFDVADAIVDKLTNLKSPYKNILIPPSKRLSDSPKALGRVAMAFNDSNVAQYGLASMYWALDSKPARIFDMR